MNFPSPSARSLWPAAACVMLTLTLTTARGAEPMHADTSVIAQWSNVTPPEPPPIEDVVLDPKTTALLILDIEERTTNMERRPRAVASVPRIAALLEKARSNGVFVAYSTTGGGSPETILPPVKPAEDDPVVRASVDKFYNTDLQQYLVDKGIETVIVVGTAAEGAVLHTATGACMRGFDVVVPVDGLSSSTLYAEQYVCWHLVNAPGSRRRTKLTTIDGISFGK